MNLQNNTNIVKFRNKYWEKQKNPWNYKKYQENVIFGVENWKDFIDNILIVLFYEFHSNKL